MGDVSEESLLDYFYSSGGKVKNADLIKTYKQFVSHNDMQLRAKYREEFKLIIDRIAVCKFENGEKYLILKKKYRQLMPERGNEPLTSGQELSSTVLQEEKSLTGLTEFSAGPAITITEAHEEEEEKTYMTEDHGLLSIPVENADTLTDAEDDMEKDSASKSDLEQYEESTGSVGSASMALDPIEKEWIYHAACGRLSHLEQLLRQDASLANKKDFTSTALHWAAKHGKEDMATAMADAGADINIKAGYTPLHIAALHGHLHIVDLLIRVYGAKENLRDYSGHFASHYLNIHKKAEKIDELTSGCHSPSQVNERRNRKLTSLFQSRKKWGSAEELAPIQEERSSPHQLVIPAFRPRKFSR